MAKLIYLNNISLKKNNFENIINYFKKLERYNHLTKINIHELTIRNKNLWNVINQWEKKNKTKLNNTLPQDRPKEITETLYRIISNENLIMNQIEIEKEYWKEN